MLNQLARSLLLILALLLPAGAVYAGTATLLLDAATVHVDAWPALKVMADSEGKLTPEQALAATEHFATPGSAYATLGVQKDVIWLRIPVTLSADSQKEWILGIDYAVLNRVDIYVARDDRIVSHYVSGNLQPEAPAPHAATLGAC